jgi:hypothetical protein
MDVSDAENVVGSPQARLGRSVAFAQRFGTVQQVTPTVPPISAGTCRHNKEKKKKRKALTLVLFVFIRLDMAPPHNNRKWILYLFFNIKPAALGHLTQPSNPNDFVFFSYISYRMKI